MKTYLLDSFNRYKRFSRKLDAKSTICNQTWVVFNDLGEREIYKFKENGTLRIVLSGRITEGKWDYDPNDDTISLFTDTQAVMVHPGMFENTVLALRVDGTDEIAFLIEEGNSEKFQPKTLDELMDYFAKKEIYFENERLRKEIEDRKRREEDAERARREQEERERARKEDEEYKRKKTIVNTFINKLSKIDYTNRVAFNHELLKAFSIIIWVLIASILLFIIGVALNSAFPGDTVFPFYLIWLWSFAASVVSIAAITTIAHNETRPVLTDDFESLLSDYKKSVESQGSFTEEIESAIRERALSFRKSITLRDLIDLLKFRYEVTYKECDESRGKWGLWKQTIINSVVVFLVMSFIIWMSTLNYGARFKYDSLEIDAIDTTGRTELVNDDYTIVSTPEWCTQVYGISGGSIEISTNYNYEISPRVGFIKIAHKGVFKTFYSSIKVIQKGDTVNRFENDKPITLRYDDYCYHFEPMADGIVQLSNQSRLPRWITVDHYDDHERDCCRPYSDKVNSINKFVFLLEPNSTDSDRCAVLQFEGGGYSTNIKLTQLCITQAEKDSIENERKLAEQRRKEQQKMLEQQRKAYGKQRKSNKQQPITYEENPLKDYVRKTYPGIRLMR